MGGVGTDIIDDIAGATSGGLIFGELHPNGIVPPRLGRVRLPDHGATGGLDCGLSVDDPVGAAVTHQSLPLRQQRPGHDLPEKRMTDSSSTVLTGAGRRILQLDGLRAIAFLMVFLHHALAVPFLWMGVDLFFVMSGFLITGILVDLKESRTVPGLLRHFYIRRVFRIIPAYYSVLAGVWLFVSSDTAAYWAWFVFFLSNFGEGYGTIPMTGVLDPMWSLAVEEQFYLIWPWVVILLNRRRLLALCLVVLVAAPVVRVLIGLNMDSGAVYRTTFGRLDLLAGGATLALGARVRPDFFQYMHRPCLAVGIIAPVVFAVWTVALSDFRVGANSLTFNTLGYSLIVVAFTSWVGFTVGLRDGRVFRFLTHPAMVHVGTISYMSYLVHRAPITILSRPFDESQFESRILVGGCALAITLLFSSITWHYFEQPIIRWGRRLTPSP